MIDIVEKKVPHSFRNKYLRNSGSVSLSTTTPMPSNIGGTGVDVLKVDDGRLSSDDNVFSSLRALLEIKSRIISISDNDTEFSDDNTLSSLRALKETQDIVDREILKALERAETLFLSKTKDDTTAGHLTIEGGVTTNLLQSSQFTPGTLGSGYLIKYDPVTGKSYIEVDEMYVRLKAVFDSLVIKESQHVGGQQIYSCASIECTKVDHIYREALFDSDHKRLRDSEGKYLFALLPSPVYRCYFTSTDGSKTILNQFVPGDLAQCRQFDIKDGTTGHAKNRYYWRYVVAVGDNYIDLSVTDCEESSDIPEAGDKIIQLGNRTDVNRQNAIIISSYGENAPSKQMLQGINSYSLLDKVILEEGFDPVTKKPYTKNYGNSYVGTKNKSSYMLFDPDIGLQISGADINVSVDRFSVKDQNGNQIAVFEMGEDGKPRLKADNINTDEILSNGNKWALKKDGSGFLASNNIFWNPDGALFSKSSIYTPLQKLPSAEDGASIFLDFQTGFNIDASEIVGMDKAINIVLPSAADYDGANCTIWFGHICTRVPHHHPTVTVEKGGLFINAKTDDYILKLELCAQKLLRLRALPTIYANSETVCWYIENPEDAEMIV